VPNHFKGGAFHSPQQNRTHTLSPSSIPPLHVYFLAFLKILPLNRNVDPSVLTDQYLRKLSSLSRLLFHSSIPGCVREKLVSSPYPREGCAPHRACSLLFPSLIHLSDLFPFSNPNSDRMVRERFLPPLLEFLSPGFSYPFF